LRVLVLAAGEITQPPWWRTQYLTPTGRRFLERVYPRTAFGAAVQATAKVARRVHDQSIGVGNVFHLFRLPAAAEGGITSFIRSDAFKDAMAEMSPLLESIGTLKEQLLALAGGTVPKTAAGPAKMGKASDLSGGAWVAKTAGVYYRAFTRNENIFPYWEAG
jgi:hypothetical protein